MEHQIQRMHQQAKQALNHAYQPYSGFSVGCSLAVGETIVSGCNVENASYTSTICAEANALGQLISQGFSAIDSILIVADTHEPCAPCGNCRQILAEFGHAQTPVYLANLQTVQYSTTLGELLPLSFSAQTMQQGE